MDLTIFGVGLGSLITGLIIGLKVLAPRTKTKVDDRALEFAELVIKALDASKPAPVSTRPPARDHRAQ